jgi:hypothetical protein
MDEESQYPWMVAEDSSDIIFSSDLPVTIGTSAK